MCQKYGFIEPGSNLLQVNGHPDDGLVTFTYKIQTSLVNVKLPSLISRTFKIIEEEEEEWLTNEILCPIAWGKEEIWAQLCSIKALPHFSQFRFMHSTGEIPGTSRTLPPGYITVTRTKFPIRWRLELFSEEVVQQDIHAGISIQEAWARLHHQVPRLYQFATFNYAGMVKPGIIVSADVLRELVTISVNFEVKDHGWIEYPPVQNVSNMLTRQEIHAYFAQNDPRVPPLAEYLEEETRPYLEGVPICFYLKDRATATDSSDEGPGRLGGDTTTGFHLPAIKYGAKPINTADSSDPKVPGSLKGQLVTPLRIDDSDSGQISDQTDSAEEGDEAHRLQKIAAALHND
jgi:hypothetical protein